MATPPRNLSGWLPNQIGPIDLQANGDLVVQRRKALNISGGGVTVVDNPEQDRTDIVIEGGGGTAEVAQDIAKSAGSDIDRVRGLRGVTIAGADGAPGIIGAVPVYNAVGGSTYKLKKPTNEGWFNVRDYGAIGDGVANDLPAFEAAMAAAKTATACSQTIYIPDGVYYLADTLHVTESLRIRGPAGSLRFSAGGARLKFAPNKTGIWLHTFASSAAFCSRTGSALGTEIDHLTIETTQLAAGTIPLWQPSTAYTVGQVVRSLNDNRFVYECVVAGTSGAVQPMHDADYDTIGGVNTGKQWNALFDDPNDGSGTLEWRTRARSGIHSLVQCNLHDLFISAFLNSAVLFTAYLTAPYYNSSTSNSSVENVHVAQCGVGIYIFGGDAGVCKVTNCIVESCGYGGPWETQARTITGATNASPIVVTTNLKHQINVAKPVVIAGVGGNTAANGTWTVAVISDTSFSLTGSTGNGAYTSGGTASQVTNGGLGYLDSAQYGSHWDNCNAIGNTGRAFFRPVEGFGTSVWSNPYIEGDQPNPFFNGLVLGGVWGVDSEALGLHRGYNGMTGYWNRLWVKDFANTGRAEIRIDDPKIGANSFMTRLTDYDGDLILADRYRATGTHKGWWVTGNKSGLDDRRLVGFSTPQAEGGAGFLRTFWGEFRGDTTTPYFIAYTPDAKKDPFLRQAQGIGGHYLPGDRYESTTGGSSAIGQVCSTEGFASPNVWATPLNPSVHYDVLNFGRPTHTIEAGGYVYAITKTGSVGGTIPTFPTTYLTNVSHPRGGIVPYRWRASVKWRDGDFCSPAAARNGHYYKATVSGADADGYVVGAASTPTFPTGGGATVVETGPAGTITWTEQGSDVGTYVADGPTEWQCVGPVAIWTDYASGGSGEVNTASNLGASGASPFKSKVGVDLQFRKIIGTGAVTVTENTNDVTISASAGSGEANTASNLGASGSAVFSAKVGVDLQFRKIIGTSPIGVTQNTNDCTIALIGGSNGNLQTWTAGAPTWNNTVAYIGESGSVATVGFVRCVNNTNIIVARNAANSGNLVGMCSDNADGIRIGMDSAGANQAANLRINAVNFAYHTINGSNYLILQSSYIATLQPLHVGSTIGGSVDFSNPFRFALATIVLSGSSQTTTLTAAQYSCPILEFGGTPASFCDVILPNSQGAIFNITNLTGNSNFRVYRNADSANACAIGVNKRRSVHYCASPTSGYVFSEVP